MSLYRKHACYYIAHYKIYSILTNSWSIINLSVLIDSMKDKLTVRNTNTAQRLSGFYG